MARRIGKNELTAIAASEATAGSQKKYFSQIRHDRAVNEYAQKFVSDPGKQNGLYWPATEGRPSPLDELGDFGKVIGANPAISLHFSMALTIGSSPNPGASPFWPTLLNTQES